MRARVGELAHAAGEVLCDAPWRDLHLAPGAVDVEKDEQVGGCVEAILAIVGSICLGAGGIGWHTSPTSWIGLSPKQTTGRCGSGGSA